MALFHANFPRSGDFSPLFRLLDDYDAHRSTGKDSEVRAFSPRFDVRETENGFHFDGELPGIDQKNIEVEFPNPQTMVVKGHVVREYETPEPAEKEAESEENKSGHRFWASERSIGEFQRVFSFPSRVDPDRTQANLKNGILSIEVPKATAPAAKKITVG
ncbi:hypothetical protein N7475_000071 [Penicillium sp. IBT 31633x]|nr:hypothetical protein N7475_000071 [Penicillium sp. IBT 31633x]